MNVYVCIRRYPSFKFFILNRIKRKDSELFCNTERHYLQAIYCNQKAYMSDLNDRDLLQFRKCLANIYNQHKSLYKRIKACGQDLNEIFELLTNALKDDEFSDYQEYSILAVETEEFLNRSGNVSVDFMFCFLKNIKFFFVLNTIKLIVNLLF